MRRPVSVLKFGSSVLTGLGSLTAVVDEIAAARDGGRAVVAVVSAIGRHTERLLARAQGISGRPAPEAALAELLGTGERQSAALLTIALERKGVPAALADAETLALTAAGPRLDADPVSVDAGRLRRLLAETPVVAVPGFVARHERGGPALLGRGGSDLTAAFLATAMDADECRLVKDVDGIYTVDPALTGEAAGQRYEAITYDDALAVAGPLVQPKAIEHLAAHGRRAVVAGLLKSYGTTIGSAVSVTARASAAFERGDEMRLSV